MSEKQFEAKPIVVKYICDDCGEGEMQPSGMMLTSNPPQWTHSCTRCGANARFPEKYPRVFYQLIGEH